MAAAMRLLTVLTVWMMTSHNVGGAQYGCPYEPICVCTQRQVRCRDLADTHLLPPRKNGTYPQTELYIQNTNISSIGTGELSGGLTMFFSEGNPLTDIANGAFLASDATLSHVFIHDSHVTHVPSDVTHLHNLHTLDVARNKITSLDAFTFPSSLTKLDVYDNRIATLTLLDFHNDSSSLEWLDLHLNPLAHIQPGAFVHLSALNHLDLSQTQLTRLPAALGELPRLTNLVMYHVTSLTCSCENSATLLPWYDAIDHSSHSWFAGSCGSYHIKEFFDNLMEQCPQVTGGSTTS